MDQSYRGWAKWTGWHDTSEWGRLRKLTYAYGFGRNETYWHPSTRATLRQAGFSISGVREYCFGS